MIKIFKFKDTEWIKEDIDVKPDILTVWLKYEIKDDDYKERYFQEDVEFNSLTPNINISRIESLVFDVNGLDKNYMTQIEIVKENDHYTLYTMPNRDKNVIDNFVKEIKGFK